MGDKFLAILTVTFFIILFSTLSSNAQQEQWLQYHSSREARQIVRDMGIQSLEISSIGPPGAELPEFKSEKPVFARWKSPLAKDGGVWMAFDRSKKNGPYDLLYIDSNSNNQLNNETAVAAYRTETYGRSNYYSTSFGPVKVTLELEGEIVAYHLNPIFNQYENQVRSLYVYPGGWYQGIIDVGNQKKLCVLIDYNVDGTFDDKGLEQHDRIRIGTKASEDTRFVGKYIEVENEIYELEVARDGAYIKIKKAEYVKHGNIHLQPAITVFSAGGENGLFFVSLDKGAGKLPVGKYKIERWQIDRKDDKNNSWQLSGRYFSSKGIFDVTEDAITKLDVGEPVFSTLDVRKISDSEYSFRQQLTGRLGESIERSRKGDSRPEPPPKLWIKSEDGTFNNAVSFEYG